MPQTASSVVKPGAPAWPQAGWPSALLLICIGLQFAAFAVDLLLPLGFSISVLYVAAILVGLWLPWRRAMSMLAMLATVLTVLGYFLSPPGPLAAEWAPVINRSLSIAMIWTITVLAWRHLGDMEALRRSQARLREAQRIAHFGHFEADFADAGNSYWCDQCLQTLGADRSDRPMSLQRFIEDYVHPEDRARVDASLRKAASDGQRFGIEFRIVRADAGVRHVRSEGEAVRRGDARSALLIGTLLDVSEQHAAEEALRRSEERFRIVQELSLDGFTILNAVRDKDGAIVDFEWEYANPTALHLLHSEGETLVGKRLLQRLPGNAGPSDLFRHYVRVVETGQPHDLEFLYEGEAIRGWFRNMAVKLGDGVAVSFTDITDRKRTDTALREQEARLRSILETAPEALITIDERGAIESFSRSAELLFGYQAEEVVGRNVKMLMPSPYSEEHDEYLARYLRTGEKRIIGIGRVVQAQRKDGTVFPIELAVGEATVGGKRLFSGFVRDLTAKERMEQELRQAQKMEAVGQLTGGIAHDFNNLLTVIVGNLEMLEMRLDGDERQRALLKEAQDTAQLGAQLTERLLAFGRRQPLQPKLTDVGQLIQELSVLIRRTLGETIEVRLHIAPRLRRTLVDPGQLQNALLNLAINARDAMPDGGTLTIEASNAELDADYAQAHAEVRPGRYVMIAVTDTGAGMSAAVQEHAFEPFFTTKALGAGSGLGLSMVYGFVKQSKGHVQLYSEVGRGTTVRLYLPQSEAAEQAEETAGPPLAAFKAAGETVLVVEDDPRVRRVSVARLLDLGYRVLEAETGPAALVLLQRHPEIDLLFTDTVMPGGMNGGDLAREARARRPELKVLFTSGYAEPEIVRKGLVDDANWLRKPYTAVDLARTLHALLDQGRPQRGDAESG